MKKMVFLGSLLISIASYGVQNPLYEKCIAEKGDWEWNTENDKWQCNYAFADKRKAEEEKAKVEETKAKKQEVKASVLSYVGEQTICYSQKDTGDTYGPGLGKIYLASLGDAVALNGGKCGGSTLPEMNKKGWRLIQVVPGLDSSFGMVFEKVRK